MRRVLLIFSSLLIIGLSAKAQQFDLHIQDVVYCNATHVEVPITADQAVTMNSMQFAFQWEGAGLSFDSISTTLINVTSNTLADTAIVIWSIPGSQSFNAGDTLFTAHYTFVGTLNTTYIVEYYTGTNFNVPQMPRAWNGGTELTVTPIDGSATVSDDDPIFQNCPTDITANASAGNCNAQVNWTLPTVIDCDNNAGPIMELNMNAPGQNFDVGTTLITYVVMDADMQTDTCRFNITVFDTQSPTISCTSSDITVTVPQGTTSTTVTDAALVPTTTDNCPNESLSYSRTFNGTTTTGTGNVNGQTFELGTTMVTYTVTDASGNTVSCNFNVVVQQQGGSNGISLDIGDENINCCEDSIKVPVIVQNTITFRSFNLAIYWDGLGLDYTQFESDPLNLIFVNIGLQTDTLIVGYNGPSNGITVNAGDTLFTLTFDVLNCNVGSSYDVKFYDGNNFFIPNPPSFFSPSSMLITPVTTSNGVVNINDAMPPTITCPADQAVDFDANCEASLQDYTSSATPDDDCDPNPTVSQSPSSGTTITAATVVTLTVTDDTGNTATCTFTVTPEDNTAPTINCPADQTVDFDAHCESTLLDYTTSATVNDNCDNNPTITQSPAAGTKFNTATVVTLTATDNTGNSMTCTFTVTPEDNTNPVINCPGNQNVDLDGNCEHSLADYTTSAIASDNCDMNLSITQSPSAASTITTATVVTLTATDDAGNSATCTFTVTPADNEAPDLACPANQSVVLNANCEHSLTDYRTSATVMDNCDATPTLTQSPAPGTVISANTVVTLTATDDAGNSISCTFTVTVSGGLPTISCPADQNVDFDNNCFFSLPNYTSQATTSSGCGGNLSVTQSPAAGTNITTTTVITLTVTDAGGNSATCTFSVIPADNTDPTISCPGNQSLVADANCTAVLTNYASLVTSDDNCDNNLTVTQSPPLGTSISAATVVTMTVTDDAGNSASCTFTVSLLDQTAPSISCPADMNVDLDLNCEYILPDFTGAATVSDNCDANVSVSQSPAPGIAINVNTTIVLTATDNSGNSNTCSFQINTNQQAPTIICPADRNVSLGANCEYVLEDFTSLAMASSDCAPIQSITQDPAAGTILTAATIITLTATDFAGNSASCNFAVNPVDDVAPTVSCPGNQSQPLDIHCQAVLNDYTSLITASDFCDNSLNITQSPSAGTTISSTTIVTLTATDDAGNSNSCTFQVITTDGLAPSISCPADQSISLGFNCQASLADYRGDAIVLDNCDPNVTVSQSPAPGTTISGQTVVTLTATDDAGNSNSCTFTLTPNDAPPTINCPTDQTEFLNANCEFVLSDYRILASVQDDCDASIDVTQSPAPGTVITARTTITLTATDDSGNTATCTFDVVPEDNVAPMITCPANQTVSFDDNCQFTLADYRLLTMVADNCDPHTSIVQIPAAGTVISSTTTVTIEATDLGGNSSSCSFLVIPSDDMPPQLSCPMDLTVNAAPGDTTVNVSGIAPQVSDNCGLDRVIYTLSGATSGSGLDDASGIDYQLGNTTVTYTATDDVGNTSQCTFDIQVNGPVVIACPSDTMVNNEPGTCVAIVNDISLVILMGSDRVVSVTYELSGATTGTGNDNASGLQFNVGLTTVTYTVIDIDNYRTTCDFEVRVKDTEAPTITCPADVSVDNAPGLCAARINSGLAPSNINDNCGIQSVVYNLSGATSGGGVLSADGEVFNAGITTVTFTVTDIDGNTTDCSFTVTVNDVELPMIDCPADVQAMATPTTAIVNNIAPTFSDNCGVESLTYTLSGATVAAGSGDASGTAFNIGTTTVIYTVTDESGLTASCGFSVMVSEGLLISCPADQMLSNDPGTCNAVVNNIDVSFNLDPSAIQSISYTLTGATSGSGTGSASGQNFNLGTTTVSYSVSSNSGEMASCSFEVQINDTESPQIECPASLTVQAAQGANDAVVNNLTPLVSDNCAVQSVSYSLSGATAGTGANDASGLSFNIGTTTVIYTVSDAAGNTADCSFNITVDPAVANDLIDCPSDVFAFTAAGICSANINNIAPTLLVDLAFISSITYTLGGATSGSGVDDASGLDYNAGTTTVTYLATDIAGNMDICSFSVTITDVEAPAINCPNNQVLLAGNGACTAVVNGLTPGISDNCAVQSLSYSLSGATVGAGANDASGTEFNAGQTTVTYTVSDQAGNTNSCSFTISVTDNQPPSISCPNNQVVIAVNNNGTCSATVNGLTPSVSDNCGVLSISYTLSGATTGAGANDASGTAFNTGQTTVTYTASDEAGNTNSCSFTVSVTDNEAPSISCPSGGSFNTDFARCYATINNLGPVVSDNCGMVNLSYSMSGATTGSGIGDASGTTFNVGVTILLYTASDAAGNSIQCPVQISVSDNEDPFISCPDDQIAQATFGNNSVAINDIAPIPVSISDNCGVQSIDYTLNGATSGTGINDASGTSFNIGLTTVTYLVTDFSGNTFSCSFNVTIDAPPVVDLIDCPADIVVPAALGQCSAVVNGLGAILLTDPSNIQSLIYQLSGVSAGSGQGDPSGMTFGLGQTTIKYIAIGTNGQMDECSFTVLVVDQQLPVWNNCPTDMQLVLPTGLCEMEVDWQVPNPTDNCGIMTITTTDQPGTFYSVGTTVVTYTAYDIAGNSATCTFSVNISDQEAPVIDCPPSSFTIDSGNGCDAIVSWDAVTATDNCPGHTLTSTHQPGDVFPVGTTVVLYVATDANGNTANCSFEVTVEDDVPPVIANCPDDITLESESNLCGRAFSWEGPTVSDNCSLFSIICDPLPGSIFPIGTTIVTCVATDMAGNIATCSFRITVEDNTPPLISCGAAIEMSVDGQIISDPDNIILSTNPNGDCSGLAVNFELPEVSDNCTLTPALSQTDQSGLANGDVFPIGTTILQYQANDESGNAASCDLSITIIGLETVSVSVVGNSELCEGEPLQLLSNTVAGATCVWTGPDGFSSTDQNPTIPVMTQAKAGTYLLTCTLTSGCVINGSIEIGVFESPNFVAVADAVSCDGQLSLMGDVGLEPEIVSWLWSGPCNFSSTDLEVNLNGLSPECSGTYTLLATSEDGCTAESSVEVTINSLPKPELDQVCDNVLCLDDICTLTGTQYSPQPDQYHWATDRPGEAGLPAFTNDNELMVSPTDTGVFTYYYWVSVDGCTSEMDSVTITVTGSPDAVDDQLSTDFETTIEDLPLMDNDLVFQGQNVTLSIVSNPQHGSLIPTAQGTYDYVPQSGYIGSDQFTYQICYDCADGQLCDIATVDIEITFEGDCLVPTLISPNGDGINDELRILCLETDKYPNNDILIFNQWGDQVFHAQPYLNNWNGTLNGEQGKDLPDGTYYYVLRKDEQSAPQKGFVTIFR